MAPTLTVNLRNFAPAPPAGGWQDMIDRAVDAEEAGVDRLIVVDHVVMGEDIDAYDGASFPTGPDGQWLEPLTILGVVAGVTSRIRLSTGILIVPLRRPVVLAKSLATLDVLSGGRVDLGVGVGWQREEYEAAGLDFEARGDLLDESLAICKALWGDQPASFSSERVSFDRIWCEPRPAQPGGVPLWISGRLHRRTLDRIARFGDGWIPWGDYLTDVRPGIPLVRRALEDAGRDPAGFEVRASLPLVRRDGVPDIAATVAPVPELAEAGVTDFNLGPTLPGERTEAARALADLVGAFREAAGS